MRKTPNVASARGILRPSNVHDPVEIRCSRQSRSRCTRWHLLLAGGRQTFLPAAKSVRRFHILVPSFVHVRRRACARGLNRNSVYVRVKFAVQSTKFRKSCMLIKRSCSLKSCGVSGGRVQARDDQDRAHFSAACTSYRMIMAREDVSAASNQKCGNDFGQLRALIVRSFVRSLRQATMKCRRFSRRSISAVVLFFLIGRSTGRVTGRHHGPNI